MSVINWSIGHDKNIKTTIYYIYDDVSDGSFSIHRTCHKRAALGHAGAPICSRLEMLVDADGAFHKMDFDRPPPFTPPLDLDRMHSSRFFMVESDADGNTIDVNLDQISSIDMETAKGIRLDGLEVGERVRANRWI